jgi:hypothetical protein
MINDILKAAKSDVQLAGFIEGARECAHVYLLAKQTYKGFENMGEIETLREEFKNSVDRMIVYCLAKGLMAGACTYDLDSFAAVLMEDMPIHDQTEI